MHCLWAQTLRKALEEVEAEAEVEVALQYLVSKFRLLDEMRAAFSPSWKPLSAKLHVGFRNGTVS